MVSLLLLAGFGLFAAILWLTIPRVVVVIREEAADPYAAEVARFRRELHDWDRHA